MASKTPPILRRPTQPKRQQKTRPALLKLPKLPWKPHPASCHCFHSRSQTKFRALRFLHIPHCKAAKHSEDAQKARKEAEAAHTEKQTALTDAAAAKKLGPERMYLNESSCCEMFHCAVSLCDKLWSFVLTFVANFLRKEAEEARQGSTALPQFCSFALQCLFVSSSPSSAFDLKPWDALILWFFLVHVESHLIHILILHDSTLWTTRLSQAIAIYGTIPLYKMRGSRLGIKWFI